MPSLIHFTRLHQRQPVRSEVAVAAIVPFPALGWAMVAAEATGADGGHVRERAVASVPPV
jgi:hypothetical protein